MFLPVHCFGGGMMVILLFCSVFRFLQNSQNISETKLPLAPDISFFSNPYSEKMTLYASIKWPFDKLCVWFC